MNVSDIAARDGWQCWICGNQVDPDASPGGHHAGSVDHVVPRKYGGDSEPDNLRLAHRRCNSKRGHALPELAWPADLVAIDSADLWQAIRRLVRKPGTIETIALFLDVGDAQRATSWIVEVATTVTGRSWTAYAEERASLQAIRLTTA